MVGQTGGLYFNDIISNGYITSFVAEDDLGTVNPSVPSEFRVDLEQLSPPVIVSAVGGINSAKIAGSAMSGAKIKLELAGLTAEVTASYHAVGTWEAGFSGVPPGKHTVLARATDPFSTFADSQSVSKELESEGVIVRPLTVTFPTPGWEVERRIEILGVATPDRGPVLIQLGGGAVGQGQVGTSNNWNGWVVSPVYGPEVPLKVWLPTTGEEISYTLNVKPFGDPNVTRCVKTFDRSLGRPSEAFHIEGTLDLDNEVYYYGRGGGQYLLAAREIDGTWSFYGRPDPLLLLHNKVIDGKLYPCVELTVPSNHESIFEPLINTAPILTSPRIVGTKTLLYGLVGGGGSIVSVFVSGQDRQVVRGTPPDDEGREWFLELDGLTPGPLHIELSSSFSEANDHLSERATYVLEVVDNPAANS
jgi:hypothetical protein